MNDKEKILRLEEIKNQLGIKENKISEFEFEMLVAIDRIIGQSVIVSVSEVGNESENAFERAIEDAEKLMTTLGISGDKNNRKSNMLDSKEKERENID